MIEKKIANSSFFFAIVFFTIKSAYRDIINPNMIEISIYMLIITSALFTVIYVQQLKNLFSFIIGGVTFTGYTDLTGTADYFETYNIATTDDDPPRTAIPNRRVVSA